VLKKGWVQHTTVGSGMWHSEINNLPDRPLRFIQLWFLPATPGLPPSVEQKSVEQEQRKGRFLPLVSNTAPSALRIVSEAEVLSSFLGKGQGAAIALREGWGAYLCVLEGGPVAVNGKSVPLLGAAMLTGEKEVEARAEGTAELLLVLAGPAGKGGKKRF
jgi:redox-sensitive bicupin YhaK (pirin superfamily)